MPRRSRTWNRSSSRPERCPGCFKSFRSLSDTLRHMNQRQICRLRIERLFNFSSNIPSNGLGVRVPQQGVVESHADSAIAAGNIGTNPQGFCDSSLGSLDSESEGVPEELIRDVYSGAAKTYGRGPTFMDKFDSDRMSEQRKTNVYHPFLSRGDWQFGSYLSRSSMSMATINALLSLELIRSLSLSFSNAKELRKLIEQLPAGPKWHGQVMKTSYPTKDPVVLYFRDPLLCIESLFSNPLLQDYIELAPYRLYKTAERLVRIYTEWMSGDVAERMQVCTINSFEMSSSAFDVQEKSALPPGATLLGSVLSSDKTTITAMTGDRTAYPLLITLANIKMRFRMKGSQHAFLLLALLPVAKFIHPIRRVRSLLQDRLTHECLDLILDPLKKAATLGIMLTDPLGCRRFCFTPLASYIVDTPEATMLAGVAGRSSPVTIASSQDLGDNYQHPPRTRAHTIRNIKAVNSILGPWDNLDQYVTLSTANGLNGVHEPFWRDWAMSEPCVFLTPEMLHHWHKFFWDHDAKWCIKALGNVEIDFRFSLLPPVTGFRHFKSGISHLKQVTGRDHREMQRYMIAAIAGAVPREFVLAIRALNEFRYLAQAEYIDDLTRQRILKCLHDFHLFKQCILDIRARVGKGDKPMDHFRLPKLELLWSVISQIELNGAPLQWSADITEHAHIQYVKDPAEKTNNQNYNVQICQILGRDDKAHRFDLATAIRVAGVSFGLDPTLENEDDDEAENGIHTSTTSALMSEISPVSDTMRNQRPLFDLFKEAALLLSGEIKNIPRPIRTLCVGMTALRIPRDPHITKVTVDDIARLFGLPDLRPALADYISRYRVSNCLPFKIGGRRTSSQNCDLPFSNVQVFCKLRIQNRGYHPPYNVLPAQSVNIFPPSKEWPLGRYDSVIINVDPQSKWPKSGIIGHIVGQIRVIFRPIIPRGSGAIPALNGFLAYVQRYDFVPQAVESRHSILDPVTGLYSLKRSLRSDGTRIGDIIPVTQFRSPAHLIPRFGAKANPQWTKESSLEYCRDVWLNTYFDKEIFYSLRSNDECI